MSGGLKRCWCVFRFAIPTAVHLQNANAKFHKVVYRHHIRLFATRGRQMNIKRKENRNNIQTNGQTDIQTEKQAMNYTIQMKLNTFTFLCDNFTRVICAKFYQNRLGFYRRYDKNILVCFSGSQCTSANYSSLHVGTFCA